MYRYVYRHVHRHLLGACANAPGKLSSRRLKRALARAYAYTGLGIGNANIEPLQTGTWRLQADVEQVCFASFSKIVVHVLGLVGVLGVVFAFPVCLFRRVKHIVVSGLWDDENEQIMYGGFYGGLKPRLWWFFLVQYIVGDVFLAITEIALMSEPTWVAIVTAATLTLYCLAILFFKTPYEAGVDLFLDVAENVISVFAGIAQPQHAQ